MFSFLAVFPDTSIHQAFSMNTLHRWVSQMGRLRPKMRNSYEEWQSLQRVSLSEDSLLSSQTSTCSVSRYFERQCFLCSLTGVKNLTHRLCQVLDEKSTTTCTSYYICVLYGDGISSDTITRALLWHANALERPGLCCFPATEPNKNSKKASSSVSSLSVFTTNTVTHIYMHVFNTVTFIHASRVQEHVIKTDQNNKRTHIFKGWEGQKHGKKKKDNTMSN